jgi:putative hydrolase of the HAD superfamily
MAMSEIRYPTVLFDWGDTVMKDDPESTVAMVEWPHVEAVQGIGETLEYLASSGRHCILATSANISDEGQIRAALARVNLDRYFQRIYSFTNTGLSKGEAFYQYILSDLGIPAQDVLMIGDHLEKDVLAANAAGLRAAWFNARSAEVRTSAMHHTFHTMRELLDFFTSLDRS